jgi:hypothetical protein
VLGPHETATALMQMAPFMGLTVLYNALSALCRHQLSRTNPVSEREYLVALKSDFQIGSRPIVTPFRNGQVDYDAYECLREFQIEAGAHGVLHEMFEPTNRYSSTPKRAGLL